VQDPWLKARRSTRRLQAALLLVVSLAASLFAVPPVFAATPEAHVLVRVAPGAETVVADGIRAVGGHAEHPLEVLSGFRAEVPPDALPSVRALPGVVAVIAEYDIPFDAALYDPEKLSSSLYQVARNIGVDELWKDGYTGAGVDVAVIDSGVRPLPEFAGRLVNGPDLSFDADGVDNGDDDFGHGTNMAGIIAGRDPAVSLDAQSLKNAAKRQFVGIAPAARIVNVKVAAADGAVDVSQVIAGIDWVVQHRDKDGLNIRVLNLSFGTDGVQDYQVDPLAFAVENAWKHGIVVVVSAGNAGYGSPQLNNPATDPFVIAVGASDTNRTTGQSDDFIADFSSRGDITRRPDLLAPGRSIVSLRDAGSLIDETFPSARIGDRLFRGSGTSQAAAVTSGAVAVLLQQYPSLTPDEVKAALVNTGLKLKTRKGEVLETGMKSIDLHRAADKVKDVLENKIVSAQNFGPATGLGSLEAARGSEHVSDGTTILQGEIDVTGAPWDPSSWRNASWDSRSWRDDDWLSRSWRTDGWTSRSWRTNGWSSRSWRTDDWTSRSWRGSGWLAAEFVATDPPA
jgi:subtilisin family serine protease